MAKKNDKCCDWFGKIKTMHGKDNECSCGYPMMMLHHKGGFVGRFLFIIGILLALNTMGIARTTPFWVTILIVVGFTLMRL